MKKLSKYAVTLFSILFCVNIFGQTETSKFPEKLTLFFNNRVKAVVESREILKIPHDKKQDSIFNNLIMDLDKVQDSLSRISSPLKVFYYSIDKNRRKLKVASNSDTKAEFIFTGNSDTVSSSFFSYRIEYDIDKNNKLVLYTNNLLELNRFKNISFADLIQQAQSDIFSRKIAAYKTKNCLYQVENNKIDIAHAEINQQSKFIISPGADFGLSYLNDRFLSNVSASVGYLINPKTERVGMVGLSGTMYLNMNPSYAYMMQGNYFIDAFFQLKQPNHPFYYARDTKILLGYLVNREGDIFPKNTWRFGLDMPAGENFRIEYIFYNNNSNNGNSGIFEIGLKYKFL
jgi:hypothetical protein